MTDHVVPDPESLLAHRDFVRAIARSLLYDEHAAEDVVQETWLAAIKAPTSVSRGWLATVARNLAVTRIRGDVRRRVREAAAARPEGVPSNAEILAREHARRSVVEEVLALPEPHRTTVLLRHLEELSPREVARRMDVPVETVRTRTRRAIELLRVRLDARHEDDRRGLCLALIAWGHGTSRATGAAAAAGGAFLVGTKLVAGAAVVVLGLATWLAWPHAHAPEVPIAKAPPLAPPVEKFAPERPRAPASPDRTDVAVVTGRAVTARHTPVADAFVRAEDGATTSVDSAGRFRLTAPPGTSVEASAPGFRPASRAVASGRTAQDLGDIALTGSASASISVAGADGAPISGARVAWTQARSSDEALNLRVHPPVTEAEWVDVGETGDDGRVAAEGLPSVRPILVRALLGDGVPIVEGPATLPAEGSRTIAIVVPARHRLRVESLYRHGETISPVRVTRTDGAPGARWTRAFESRDGFVELLLQEGVYEVGVCPEGRHLLRQDVTMDRDREVSLDFERLDVIHMEVTDPDGLPVPAFYVTLANHEPSPADARRLFDMAPFAGRDGAADLRIPVKDPDVPVSRSAIVRAPGFAVGRVTIPWFASTEVRRATLRLERGATVSGRIAGIEAGTEVRLFYRSDPSGVAWRWDDAPLLDATRAGPGGTYSLRALGPGTYEVRVHGETMDVPVGEVVVAAAGETRFDATHSPSSLEVTLLGAGLDVAPALIPLLPGSKWQGGADAPARESIRGVRRGATVVFDGVAAGRYVLDRTDRPGFAWGASPDAMPIELKVGQTFTTQWRPRPAATATFHVVPATAGGSGLLYAIVRATSGPSFAAALAWQGVPLDGDVRAVVPGAEPFVLVVARTATAAEHVSVFGEIVPLAVRRCASAADLDGARIATPPGGTIVVQAEGVASARVELVHDELSRVLKEPRSAELGRAVTDLIPGRWRITVAETASPERRGETTVDVTPGSSQTVRVVVR